MECLKGLEHKKMSDHCRSAVFEEEQEEVLIQGMKKRNPKSLQINYRSLLFLKFVYSEKATKFCEICTLLLTTVHPVKSKVEILQNFVAFSEYMNFKAGTK